MNETTNTVAAEVTATAPVATEKPAKSPKAEKAPKEKKATATKAEKPAKEVKEKAPSTKSKVIPMVAAAIAAGTPRKDTLAKMQSEFGISAACANTYYQNVKSAAWK